MGRYIIRRFLYMIPLLFLISIVTFIIIKLPPFDYVEAKVAALQAQGGGRIYEEEIEMLRRLYGLDKPALEQYLSWIWNMFRGDMGTSFALGQPVRSLIMERLPLTVAINIFALIIVYIIAIPIGIFSATHQYSIGDYIFTFIGFIGVAVPGFLIALVLLLLFQRIGFGAGGLFSPEYQLAPWSFAKFFNMLQHLTVAVIVESIAGTAGLIRVMRGCLLDELNKQYVVTARAKGLDERKLLFKYPIRIAINPIISTIGWMLPAIVSGGAIVEIVLNLPTIGPLILDALLDLDMYLAGSSVMMLAGLTIIGTFISDILLVAVDPRIRFDKRA